MGVKKSTVRTAARSSRSRTTAASSLVSNPSRSRSSIDGGTMLFKIVSRSPGPHLAAQPPFEVSWVSRTVPRLLSMVIGPFWSLPTFLRFCGPLWQFYPAVSAGDLT